MNVPPKPPSGASMQQGSVAFIGGGHMARALIEGLVRSGWRGDQIAVLEPQEAQRSQLACALGVRALAEPDPLLSDAGLVVWAVKPQVLQAAIEPVRPLLRTPLHVSVCAGVGSRTLSRWLASRRVVRVMPNTPALVGAGVTGMFALDDVAPADRARVEALFKATGDTFWVDSDERIDAVTASSGSGPGYVFEFLATLQSAIEALGFSPEPAGFLAVRTAAGALTQASQDTAPLATLRDRVTSKGGTTEAGLQALSRGHFSEAVMQAIASGYRRARALSEELDR